MPIPTNVLRCAALFGAAAMIACGGATEPGPGRVRFIANDPLGDTVSQAQNDTIFAAADLRRMSGYTTPDSLILSLVFSRPITAPGVGDASGVAAIIEMDIDQDSTTGIPPFLDPFDTPRGLGVEKLLIIPAPDNGADAALTDEVTRTTTVFPAAFDGDSVTLRLPLAAVTSLSEPIRVMAVVGTVQRPTDVVPNERYVQIEQVTGRTTTPGR